LTPTVVCSTTISARIWLDVSLSETTLDELRYSVVDAMLASTFEALEEVELRLDALASTSTDEDGAQVRKTTLRAVGARLAAMRRCASRLRRRARSTCSSAALRDAAVAHRPLVTAPTAG
jgi:hypothetical protein